MSGPVKGAPPPDENVFRVTVYDEKGNKVTLESKEQKIIQEKLLELDQYAERLKVITPIKEFSHQQAGIEYRIDENGISRKVGDKWILLSAKEDFIQTTVLKKTKAVALPLIENSKLKEEHYQIDVKVLHFLDAAPTNKRMNEHYEKSVHPFYTKMEEFASLITKNEKQLYETFSEHGFSEFETRQVFGFLPHLLTELKQMDSGLQEVRELNLQRRFDEATEKYASVMQESGRYILALAQGNQTISLMEQLNKARLGRKQNSFSQAFEDFCKAVNVDLSKSNEPSLRDKFQLFTLQSGHFQLIFSEIKKKIEPQTDAWEKAADVVSTQTREVNRRQDEFEKALSELQKLTPSQSLRDIAHPDWQKIVKDAGWTDKDFEKFDRLNFEYAKIVEPLLLLQKRMELETNSEKKRALFYQLQRETQKAIPFLHRLNKQYFEIETKFKELSKAIEIYHIRSPIENIRSVLYSFLDRNNALNQLMENVHFRLDWSQNLFEKTFLKDMSKDRAWLQYLQSRGLNTKEVSTFVSSFKLFSKHAEPIILAKRALDIDPDNKKLQKALKEAYRDHIPELNGVVRKINKLGLKKISDLSGAVDDYKGHLQRQIASNETSPEEKIQYKWLLSSLETSAFKQKLDEWDQILFEASESIKEETTIWDPNYVKKQLSHKKMFPDQWNQALSDAEVTTEDITRLNQLFNQLNEETAPIQSEERKLERDPNDRAARNNLDKLMKKKEGVIQDIFGNIAGLAENLTRAIGNYIAWLSDEISKNDASLLRHQDSNLEQQTLKMQKERAKLRNIQIQETIERRTELMQSARHLVE